MNKFILQLLLIPCILGAANAKDLGGSGPFTFDYLLGENTNFKTAAKVVFLDYEVEKKYITQLLSQGKRVICYVNVGSFEDWRSDAGKFPSAVKGSDYQDWEGEKWLDIRSLDILLPIMRARFQAAAKNGCEGVDPDNMNAYQENTGFSLTATQQITFNKAIAKEIRDAGMLAGLKNDNGQAKELEPFTDFAVVESCAYYKECGNFSAFIKNKKPVFGIEYTNLWKNEKDFTAKVCPLGIQTGVSFILKKLELKNDYIVPCLK